jgi:hypothetical protein
MIQIDDVVRVQNDEERLWKVVKYNNAKNKFFVQHGRGLTTQKWVDFDLLEVIEKAPHLSAG